MLLKRNVVRSEEGPLDRIQLRLDCGQNGLLERRPSRFPPAAIDECGHKLILTPSEYRANSDLTPKSVDGHMPRRGRKLPDDRFQLVVETRRRVGLATQPTAVDGSTAKDEK